MRSLILAFGAAMILAACNSKGGEGDTCAEDADCEDELTCAIEDGAEEGTCEAAGTGDTDATA